MENESSKLNVFLFGESVSNILDYNLNTIEKKIKEIENENLNLVIQPQLYNLIDQINLVSKDERSLL